MKLSIITINLNNKDGLQKTIDSIVSQTFTDYEWIVIDGGSTDGSKELIEQYADHIAYWVSEPDKGVYNAMNKGIVVAKGEYLNFMNSGDCFASATVLADIFGCPHDADVLYGYMVRDTIDGRYNNISTMKSNLSWIDFAKDGFPHQSTFIKRDLFDKYGMYDETLKAVSDWKFFVKIFVYNESTYEFMPIKISIYASNGISDLYGMEERERVKKELFPIMVLKDIHKIETYNVIQGNWLARKLYFLLYRYSVWCNRHFR